MVDLGSIAGLHAHGHELHAYCAYCDRWAVLDLAALLRAGHGGRRLPCAVRCSRCNGPGRLQVRPPAPSRAPSGWIQPPVRPAASANGNASN